MMDEWAFLDEEDYKPTYMYPNKLKEDKKMDETAQIEEAPEEKKEETTEEKPEETKEEKPEEASETPKE